MRLLYVIDSLSPGGAETSLADMAAGLARADIELHVLPLVRRLDLASRLRGAGAVVHERSDFTGRVGNVLKIIDIARGVRPDLIHTTLFEADVAGRSAARLLGLRTSSSLVSDSYSPSHYAESNRLKLHAARALDATTARFVSRFHSVSSAISNSVGPRLAIRADMIDVIPRGRDPEAFPFRPEGIRERVRDQLGIGSATPLILAVGRLVPSKGMKHLIRAMPMVLAKHPEAVLLIAGRDGRSSSELQAMARNIAPNVRFLGHRSDVAHLLAAADVLCSPTEREGSPGTLIEAMAVGCPVVASKIPPVVEVIGGRHESAAYLVPVGDADAIADALSVVLTKPFFSSLHLIEGRRRFERYYSIDSVSERMADFFRRAAGLIHPKDGPG